jgi:hypothetical protein
VRRPALPVHPSRVITPQPPPANDWKADITAGSTGAGGDGVPGAGAGSGGCRRPRGRRRRHPHHRRPWRIRRRRRPPRDRLCKRIRLPLLIMPLANLLVRKHDLVRQFYGVVGGGLLTGAVSAGASVSLADSTVVELTGQNRVRIHVSAHRCISPIRAIGRRGPSSSPEESELRSRGGAAAKAAVGTAAGSTAGGAASQTRSPCALHTLQ